MNKVKTVLSLRAAITPALLRNRIGVNAALRDDIVVTLCIHLPHGCAAGVGWGWALTSPRGIDARGGGDARREWEVALHAAAKAARRDGQLTDLRVCPVAHYDQARFTAAHAALLALATAVSVCCDPSSPAERSMDPALHEVRASR